MSYRARHRRRSRAALLAPPVVIAVAGLSIGGADAHGAQPPRPVADVHLLTPGGPLAPFAAKPRVVPLDLPRGDPVALSTLRPHKKARPPASAPLVTLPSHLNVTASAIPRRVLESYVNAANLANKADPVCQLKWQTVAGIGFIESDNARSGGSANPHWNGVANPPILGPLLNGQDGFAAIPDTDGGALDGNSQWERAVGPMQFIPSTWARYAADGNHDGIKNPEQIDDATLAAANYLCATGPDLGQPKNLIRAIYAYNHSYIYVRAVLTVEAHYLNIDPAKLGINGLPKSHKRKHKHHAKITVIAPTPKPTGSSPPTTASPSPSPSGSPTPSTSPTPTPSGVPTPTGSPVVGRRPTPPPRR